MNNKWMNFSLTLVTTMALYAPRDAAASCLAPAPCVCDYRVHDAALIAVVNEVNGSTATATIEVMQSAPEMSVNLAAGDVVEVDTGGAVVVGGRFLGTLTVGCETGWGAECALDDPTREELVQLYRIIDGEGLVSCSAPEPAHRFDAEDAMSALVADDCVAALGDFVPEPGGCHDTGFLCHVAPGAADSVAPAPLTALALAAAASLLRRRARARR